MTGPPSDRTRWLSWLDATEEEAGHAALATSVRSLWRRLEAGAGTPLVPPTASPHDGSSMNLSWGDGTFVLDLDVSADGCFGWFCLDPSTGATEGSEEADLHAPPARLLTLLATHCASGQVPLP